MNDISAPSITVTKDGPIIIRNAGKFVLPDGTEAEPKPMLALCRCGRSANKPFCDGSHQRTGWSDEA